MAQSRFNDYKKLFREKSTWHWQEIMDRLGIARNSVYRLRNQLRDKEGIWLEEHIFNKDVPRGHFRWPSDTPNEDHLSISLRPAEIDALKTAVERMENVTPLVKTALKKLVKSKAIAKKFNNEPILVTPLADNYTADKLFERVSKAIRDRRSAQLSYENAAGQTKTYKFDSYVLIPSDQHLHLVGESHNSIKAGYRKPITLRLDQIKEFTLLKDKFKKPKFDAQSYASKEFGPFKAEGEPVKIRVQFGPEKAGYIKRTKRHKTQKVTIQKDGTALWQINAPLTEALVHWIVSYGPHAKVVEPVELKEQVVDWARGCLEVNG